MIFLNFRSFVTIFLSILFSCCLYAGPSAQPSLNSLRINEDAWKKIEVNKRLKEGPYSPSSNDIINASLATTLAIAACIYSDNDCPRNLFMNSDTKANSTETTVTIPKQTPQPLPTK
ncbi:MAG: hypothetical protein HQK49_17370 [Oligoflexia bacterium]|nr:hypothetical protein [Oligoflexia bacterium]